MSTFDTIVLGSTANALTAAAYAARSGKSVMVLEPSEQLGGGVMSTAAFADGFRADLGLTSGRLDAQIVSDLKLSQYGLVPIERNTITSLLPAGRSFTLTADRQAAASTIAKFAPGDAANYAKFMQLLDMAAALLKNAYAQRPSEHPASNADQANMSALVKQLRDFGSRELTEVLRLPLMSVRHVLDEWFENPELKGLLGSLAVRGLMQGPFGGGTMFNLLHHLTIGDGYFRASARGGTGAISTVLAAAAIELGAKLEIGMNKLSLILKDGAATGVRLASGQEYFASEILSDFDAAYTFRTLVEPPELDPEFNRQLRNIRYNGCVVRINFALNAVPNFTGLNEEALKGTLVSAASLAHLERAYDDAKYGGISKSPFMEVTIPSLSDPTLAPAGKHTMSIWMQYVPYRNGKQNAQDLLDLAMSQLSQYAPDLSKQVLHSQVLLPADFESKFNLSEGHLNGGDMTLNQAFYLRPIPEYAQYATPIENLYLCGSATHPGGGVSGLSGRNVANELKQSKVPVSV